MGRKDIAPSTLDATLSFKLIDARSKTYVGFAEVPEARVLRMIAARHDDTFTRKRRIISLEKAIINLFLKQIVAVIGEGLNPRTAL
jgi:hypothetical protein